MSKTYKIKWTTNAKDDLLAIVTYVKRESPSKAREIYLSIREKADSSNFFPLKGRIVPELQSEGITLFREVIASSWRVIYKIGNDTVYIMAVLDSRRNIEEILLHKLLDSKGKK